MYVVEHFLPKATRLDQAMGLFREAYRKNESSQLVTTCTRAYYGWSGLLDWPFWLGYFLINYWISDSTIKIWAAHRKKVVRFINQVMILIAISFLEGHKKDF